MIRELETAILARLRGTDQIPTAPIIVPTENVLSFTDSNTQPTQPAIPPNLEVPVSMQTPDEWLAQAYLPGINVWRFQYEPYREYFRVGVHSRSHPLDDGSGMDPSVIDTKAHQLPFLIGYEIGVRTRFQEQLRLIVEEIQRRLPPFGFGCFLTVGLADGDVEIPFTQQSFIDLSDSPRSGEREFEVRMNYQMHAWMDADTWSEEKTIRTVILDVLVPLPGQTV